VKKENNRYREEEKLEEQEVEIKVEKTKKKDETPKETEDDVQKLKNTYLRLCADYDNFRKRSIDERSQYLKYASQPLLEKLINVMDLFDKAVSVSTDDEKLKKYLIGFKMINESFKQIMNDEGIKKIEAIGKKFNPNVHHAVEIEYNPEIEEDIILKEMQSGYLYKDRMLRPSLVIVNKKEERNNENE